MVMAAVRAALLAVALLILTASLKPRGWSSFNLVETAQAEVRRRTPGDPVFLIDPAGRTRVYPTGRQDLRAACGWLRTSGAGWRGPRFFYVLFQRRLAWLSTETVFVQSRAGEASPDGGELWCRSAPIG